MKKSSVFLFIIGFAAAYLFTCYCVMPIKLGADPVTYFKESIRYAAVFKTVASCIVGTVFTVLPNAVKRVLRNR